MYVKMGLGESQKFKKEGRKERNRRIKRTVGSKGNQVGNSRTPNRNDLTPNASYIPTVKDPPHINIKIKHVAFTCIKHLAYMRRHTTAAVL